jgi:cell division protein FtsW
VLAEELGLIGTLAVIGSFSFLVWRAFSIGSQAERAGRLFAAYLAFGIGLLIGLQAFINIGVTMGVLPTKGLTLPFISYGSNSLIVTCLSLGLLLRIEYEMRFDPEGWGYVT